MKLAILLCLVPTVFGYSAGPPVGSSNPTLCTNMIPTGHNGGVSNATDQNSPPYTITATASEYTPGGSLTVTIAGTGGNQFKGFFIQARRADPARDNDVAIGTFSNQTANTQLLMCHTVANSAWAHSNNDARSTIVGTWTAPAQDEGPLRFMATIVKGEPNRSYFYTNVTSTQLAFSADGPSQQPGNPMTTPSGGARHTIALALAGIAILLAAILNVRQF
ncbi:putative ferric-chelate reductase 1 [Patiria miniata]|uniref:Reelin domain-containing protein n=1 Tax=Patiria miniata TaxID=46514 RepID=A0A913ZH83_PATMI|nr:putative ferric-chelate reductase 1 [Patiria miniata]XP_038050416.1 putative ferric-chelate reductase 1 [Patiria miniata]